MHLAGDDPGGGGGAGVGRIHKVVDELACRGGGGLWFVVQSFGLGAWERGADALRVALGQDAHGEAGHMRERGGDTGSGKLTRWAQLPSKPTKYTFLHILGPTHL